MTTTSGPNARKDPIRVKNSIAISRNRLSLHAEFVLANTNATVQEGMKEGKVCTPSGRCAINRVG